ncbi:MAG: sodium:solute symporter family protein [Pseudomonadota bacterium]
MIDIAVVTLYLAAVFAFGLVIGAKTSSFEGYAVAGRSLGSMVIFATLSASFIGGGFSIGNAEKVFLFGVANIVALWGFSFKEILVAQYLAPKMDRFRWAVSVGDIMETGFGRMGRLFSGIFALFLCSGIVGAQIGGIGAVFRIFLGLDTVLGIWIGCGIVICYTTIGGMRAVIFTDIVQFVILSIGIPLVLVFGIIYVGGIENFVSSVPAEHLILPGPDHSWITLMALFLAFAFGEALVPPYVQRLLIGRTSRAVAKGTLLAGIFSIPFFAITGFIGLVALAIDPDIPAALALPHVIATVMPTVLGGLVVAGVISIVMSSADSFLNSAGVALVNDIVRPLRAKPLSDGATLLLARVATFAVGVSAVAFALTVESVLDILLTAYTYWAPVIVVPLAATILGVQRHKMVFLMAAVAGIVSAFGWNILLGKPYGVEGFVIGTVFNAAVFLLIKPRTRGPTNRPQDVL